MLVYAGIDEAGYGPILGPLCVACSVFVDSSAIEINDEEPCNLWKRLSKAVCRKRIDKRKRIAIEDSKKLKNANNWGENGLRKSPAPHPLKHLERGVLSFLSGAKECATPNCDGDLFKALHVTPAGAAWYESSTSLPVAHQADELRISASRLHRAMQAEHISCTLMRCEAVDAPMFNSQYERMKNKSSVNFHAVLRLIDCIWKTWPEDHPRIVIDRQGGRAHYLQDLLLMYPEAQIQILEENDLVSRYRLVMSGSILTVSFVVEAETNHLPVALASMTAKYVRELHMMRMNRYFCSLMPELKPTAGYFEDARRYLGEISHLIEELRIDRGKLVRVI